MQQAKDRGQATGILTLIVLLSPTTIGLLLLQIQVVHHSQHGVHIHQILLKPNLGRTNHGAYGRHCAIDNTLQGFNPC